MMMMNIHTNLTLLETRISGLHFCHWQYMGSSANLCYPAVKKSWRYLSSFWYSIGGWQTDRQTDRWTYLLWLYQHLHSLLCVCIACYATVLVRIYQENVAWTKSLCKLLLLLLKYWGTFLQSKYWGDVSVSLSPSHVGIDAHVCIVMLYSL